VVLFAPPIYAGADITGVAMRFNNRSSITAAENERARDANRSKLKWPYFGVEEMPRSQSLVCHRHAPIRGRHRHFTRATLVTERLQSAVDACRKMSLTKRAPISTGWVKFLFQRLLQATARQNPNQSRSSCSS